MIAEYKLYHGAVLAELVHELTEPVSIDELHEEGRLSSYVINGNIGVHIKHSSQRLHPWPFTFTRQNLDELVELRSKYTEVFLIFVCHTDGMVCLSLQDAFHLLETGLSDQAWIRIARGRRKLYDISGSGGGLARKQPAGLEPLTLAIRASRQAQVLVEELSPAVKRRISKPSLFAFSWPGSRR